MQKEILTNDKIKLDIKHNIVQESLGFLLILPMLLIVYFIWQIIFIDLDFLYTVKIIGNVIFFVTIVISLVYDVVFLCKIFSNFKACKFEIVDDWVTEKKIKRGAKLHRRPHALILAKNGRYEIVEKDYYTWSKLYKMNDDAVYNSFDIDDNLFLVKIGNRNLLAYNKKFFDYIDA